MKKNIINKRKIGLLLIVLALLAAGCKKDVLNQTDPNGIDPSIWNSVSAATEYVNNIYTLAAPAWPLPTAIHNSTDEFYNTTTTELYGQLTTESVTDISGTSSTSFYVIMYDINTGIAGIEGSSLDAPTKALLKGQLYFFRAYQYFAMVKLYGGVPLVIQPFDINHDNLLLPRNKTSECIKQITADLDSCYGLPASWSLTSDGGRITKDAALALKGKVLMFWASPQFNPTDISTRWETAYQACELAYNTASTDGYKLMTNYSQIFTDETANNTERMFWRTYDVTSVSPTHGNNIEAATRPLSETVSGGGVSYLPTWNLVQAYGTKDGLSITDPSALLPATGYDAELWWLNRDPRFAASIAYNGCVWPLSGKAGRLQWNYTGMLDDGSSLTKTGFYCRKFNITTLSPASAVFSSNSGGGSGIDYTDIRFAEVLLNAAETANGSGRLGEAQSLLVLLRQARGIIAGSFNYGVAKITTRAQMFTELWREREVEFAIEGKRYEELRRTRQFDKLSGTTRQSFFCAAKSPYVAGSGSVAGKIYLDVADPITQIKPRDLINLNTGTTAAIRTAYEQYFTTSITSLETTAGTPVISWPTNYYFFPLPQAFLTTDIKLQQTNGWLNGSFDPLQ